LQKYLLNISYLLNTVHYICSVQLKKDLVLGTQERKDREREELRNRILDAATHLFVTQGFEKTSMRAIAQAVEYSPAALYLHFTNKEQLMESLFAKVFTQFSVKLMEAASEPDPITRLNLVGHKYLEFALANPAHYELMFLLPHPNISISPLEQHHNHLEMDCGEEGDKIGMEAFEFLNQCIADLAASGKTLRYDVYTASLHAWATVHGMATLHIRGFSSMFPPEHLPTMMHNASLAVYHALFID